MDVDHIDGNGLNNQRSNLRLCTASQNTINRNIPRNNTTGVKGVVLRKSKNRYMAQIGVSGKVIYLGMFKTLHEAAGARKLAEIKYHGDFIRRPEHATPPPTQPPAA